MSKVAFVVRSVCCTVSTRERHRRVQACTRRAASRSACGEAASSCHSLHLISLRPARRRAVSDELDPARLHHLKRQPPCTRGTARLACLSLARELQPILAAQLHPHTTARLLLRSLGLHLHTRARHVTTGCTYAPLSPYHPVGPSSSRRRWSSGA